MVMDDFLRASSVLAIAVNHELIAISNALSSSRSRGRFKTNVIAMTSNPIAHSMSAEEASVKPLIVCAFRDIKATMANAITIKKKLQRFLRRSLSSKFTIASFTIRDASPIAKAVALRSAGAFPLRFSIKPLRHTSRDCSACCPRHCHLAHACGCSVPRR